MFVSDESCSSTAFASWPVSVGLDSRNDLTGGKTGQRACESIHRAWPRTRADSDRQAARSRARHDRSKPGRNGLSALGLYFTRSDTCDRSGGEPSWLGASAASRFARCRRCARL